MPELLEITCPRCASRWWLDPVQLKGPLQVVYRTPERRARVESYRLRCPSCGIHIVADLEFGEEDDG